MTCVCKDAAKQFSLVCPERVSNPRPCRCKRHDLPLIYQDVEEVAFNHELSNINNTFYNVIRGSGSTRHSRLSARTPRADGDIATCPSVGRPVPRRREALSPWPRSHGRGLAPARVPRAVCLVTAQRTYHLFPCRGVAPTWAALFRALLVLRRRDGGDPRPRAMHSKHSCRSSPERWACPGEGLPLWWWLLCASSPPVCQHVPLSGGSSTARALSRSELVSKHDTLFLHVKTGVRRGCYVTVTSSHVHRSGGRVQKLSVPACVRATPFFDPREARSLVPCFDGRRLAPARVRRAVGMHPCEADLRHVFPCHGVDSRRRLYSVFFYVCTGVTDAALVLVQHA